MVRTIRKGILLVIAILNMSVNSFAQTENIPVVRTRSDSVFYAGDYLRIPIILFDFNSPKLYHSSNPMDSIRLIAGFLKNHPDLVVEVSNHTDYRSNSRSSSRLSFRRAKNIVDSLIACGIQERRLIAAGYEGFKPIVLHKDILLPGGKTVQKGTVLSQKWIDKNFPPSKHKEDYEFLMQQNRRTELKILRTDFEK